MSKQDDKAKLDAAVDATGKAMGACNEAINTVKQVGHNLVESGEPVEKLAGTAGLIVEKAKREFCEPTGGEPPVS